MNLLKDDESDYVYVHSSVQINQCFKLIVLSAMCALWGCVCVCLCVVCSVWPAVFAKKRALGNKLNLIKGFPLLLPYPKSDARTALDSGVVDL